jgi:hypothetical protein
MTRPTNNRQLPLGIILTNIARTKLARLRALERYDISFVADRLIRENSSRSSSIASSLLDFKRYMSLAVLGYRGLAVPSQQVDDVWHAFLLFTQEYAAFCRKTVGFFVHHVPTASGRKLPDGAGVAEAYRRVFGLHSPKAGHCATCTGCRASSNVRAY